MKKAVLLPLTAVLFSSCQKKQYATFGYSEPAFYYHNVQSVPEKTVFANPMALVGSNVIDTLESEPDPVTTASSRSSPATKVPGVPGARPAATRSLQAKIRVVKRQQAQVFSAKKTKSADPDAPRKLGITSLVFGIVGFGFALVANYGLASIGALTFAMLLGIASLVTGIVSLVDNKRNIEKLARPVPATLGVILGSVTFLFSLTAIGTLIIIDIFSSFFGK